MPEEDNDEKRSMQMITLVIFIGCIILSFIFGFLAKAYIFN